MVTSDSLTALPITIYLNSVPGEHPFPDQRLLACWRALLGVGVEGAAAVERGVGKDGAGVALGQGAAVAVHLGDDAVVGDAAFALPGHVVVAGVGGEAPVPALHDLLAPGELELGAAQGLLGLRREGEREWG